MVFPHFVPRGTSTTMHKIRENAKLTHHSVYSRPHSYDISPILYSIAFKNEVVVVSVSCVLS